MLSFLKIVAAVFIAMLLVFIAIYIYIKWKFRSFFEQLKNTFHHTAAGGIPPFRITLQLLEEYDHIKLPRKGQAKYDAFVNEFTSLGFETIDNYLIEESGLILTALVHRESNTCGVVYEHPNSKVWCDVVRTYNDDSSWTYATSEDHLMDQPPGSTQHFFPGDTLTTTVEKFWDEAPKVNSVLFDNNEFPPYFKKVWAKEMDWRIERGGATDAEIRRVAEKDGMHLTDEQAKIIQMQWRQAITEFHKDRALKQHRKNAELSRWEWEQLKNQCIIIHSQMQPEEILNKIDYEYFPFLSEAFADEEEEEDRLQIEKWKQQLQQIREDLKHSSPQQVFRKLSSKSSGLERGKVESMILLYRVHQS